MLANAFKILHLKKFINERNSVSEDLKTKLEVVQFAPTAECLQELEFLRLIDAYTEYTRSTLGGEHGSTAQYWIGYTELVDTFLLFNRASRTNDVDLFVFALSKLCPIFFACNRPNYARWMVKYLHNLINVDSTHPGVRAALEGGARGELTRNSQEMLLI